ncbi:hypothetical protein PROPJV5_1407 [Propionibacterium ruminifibrarum]|uniref:Uncharacterized protein n=1 Tax=Propionibacterium ruminifibrarum TaxID=1962131 RepID=A0A375I4P4_9ACTN|nr:hypothetical protein [Propionibacterium ruminifibrarum]SPF68412.1 hypothetical protein PROPJV5_1407 [Propionibacterium ruminifibrarum]
MSTPQPPVHGAPGPFPMGGQAPQNAWPGQAPQNAWPGQGPYAGAWPTPGGTPAPTGRTTRPRRTRAVIIIGAVVLALIIGAALTRTALGGSDEDLSRKIVEEYLTAVAEGDADKAKGFLSYSSADESLLTDEVLRVSNELAPMTNITVGSVTASSEHANDYLVQASYDIGDESVSTTMTVFITSRRSLLPSKKIVTITDHTRLSLSLFEDVDFTVNGVTPDTDYPDVFPGTYELAVSNEYLEITGDPIAALDPAGNAYSPFDTGPDGRREKNTVGVSEAGVQMFREKVVAEATECLASTRLSPGCGTWVPQRPDRELRCEEVREDSVHRWQEPEEAAKLQNVTPVHRLGPPTTLEAVSTQLGDIEVTATCRQGDTWTEQRLYSYEATYFGTASIDLTDPDLAVVWGR